MSGTRTRTPKTRNRERRKLGREEEEENKEYEKGKGEEEERKNIREVSRADEEQKSGKTTLANKRSNHNIGKDLHKQTNAQPNIHLVPTNRSVMMASRPATPSLHQHRNINK